MACGRVLRLATEMGLVLLGVHAEVLSWMNVSPGRLDETGPPVNRHPQVRFAAATTGPANLLIAVAATDLGTVRRIL
ncbi:hypothetical protein [Streptomyces sp. NPDC058086]|uniref:hypothetical protein n=1 Tax=Streptomyces sp. NPDC058086 TaxID=3346334 RepID=UPI0036DFDB1E